MFEVNHIVNSCVSFLFMLSLNLLDPIYVSADSSVSFLRFLGMMTCVIKQININRVSYGQNQYVCPPGPLLCGIGLPGLQHLPIRGMDQPLS